MKGAKIITIDGPSGSGKGTLAGLIAAKLQWNLLDSGALYRVAALLVMRRKGVVEDENAVAKIVETLDVTFKLSNNSEDRQDQQLKPLHYNIFLEGVKVNDAIRTEEVGSCASKIAVFPKVRKALLNRQRAFLKKPGLVADGRDMGTIVFPDAQVKFFLVASAEERARRRWDQLQLEASGVTIGQLASEIRERDYRDQNRRVAPLKASEDAITIDSTELSIEQVFERMMVVIKREHLI